MTKGKTDYRFQAMSFSDKQTASETYSLNLELSGVLYVKQFQIISL